MEQYSRFPGPARRKADTVYWADLRDNPENGFALLGVRQSLEAPGRAAEAKAVTRRFEKAWALADVTLTTSRY